MGNSRCCPRSCEYSSTAPPKLQVTLPNATKAWKRHAELGYLAITTGLPNVKLPGDIPLEEWDSWHTLVLTDELNRLVSFSGKFLNIS